MSLLQALCTLSAVTLQLVVFVFAADTLTWTAGFYAHGGASLPAPRADCQVCFFEKPKFAGESVCVGRRTDPNCTSDVISIAAPSTVGSIRFASPSREATTGAARTATTVAVFALSPACELVVNIRVTEPPYGERIDSFASDVLETGYESVVQELFVESSGTACFLAAKEINQFGRCYTKSVARVESAYRGAFHELLLFKQHAADFDVITYDHASFNRNCSSRASSAPRQVQQQVSHSGLWKRFSTSSSDLSVDSGSDATASSAPPPTLQFNIRSIEFVRPGAAGASDSDPQ